MTRKFHESWGKPASYALIFLFGLSIYYLVYFPSLSTSESTFKRDSHGRKIIKASTWNVAAINNNPFEYWITVEDHEEKKSFKSSSSSSNNIPGYNKLLSTVSNFIKETKEEDDVPLHKIFTEKMYNELEQLIQQKTNWKGLNETRHLWNEEYSQRKYISQYIKDNLIGKKRLISMPDRLSNTISSTSLNKSNYFRPTVINCYNKSNLLSMDEWWKEWKEYIFATSLEIKNKKTKQVETKFIYEMLSPIDHFKYPSLTKEEAEISLPLQTLALALFDASLVYMMNTINTKVNQGKWQDIRFKLCDKLNLHKTDKLIEIMTKSYMEEDILFLQETSSSFPSFLLSSSLSDSYDILTTTYMDTDRDQNSIILTKKGLFKNEIKDVTKEFYNFMEEIYSKEGKKIPIVKGDLIAVMVTDAKDSTKYILASFHGDTNG